MPRRHLVLGTVLNDEHVLLEALHWETLEVEACKSSIVYKNNLWASSSKIPEMNKKCTFI